MIDEGPTMSLIEHLEELRRRLIVVVVSVLGGAVVGFIFSRQVLILLRDRLPEGQRTLQFLGPADAFGAQLKIAVPGIASPCRHPVPRLALSHTRAGRRERAFLAR